MSTPSQPPTRGPRAADVARWVALLASPEPDRLRFGGACLRDMMAERKRARSNLRSWGLGDDGLPAVRTPRA